MNLFSKPSSVKPESNIRRHYPRLFKNAVLTIIKPDGAVIGRVRLDSYNTQQMTLMRLPGDLSMPLVKTNEKLYIQGASESGEPFTLQVTVQDATRLYIACGNLSLVENPNRRLTPRYIVNRKAELFNPTNPKLANIAHECTLVDISLTGAKVYTNTEYELNQTVRLRVELYDKAGPISFICQIIRIQNRPNNQLEYGLIFEELTQEKRRYLSEDLRILQENASKPAR